MRTENILKRVGFSIGLAVVIAAALGSKANAQTQQPSIGPSFFGVAFTDCVESIGVTLAPTASVRAYVPEQFILAGDGQPVTPLVVRTAQCAGIATADQKPKPGEIVQIGAVIIPPDFTGDINNYTIWYYTSDAKLAVQLRQAGVDARHVPTIDYNHADDGFFNVHVPKPGIPQFDLLGTVQPSADPAGSFLANWWQQTPAGIIKMATNVPLINIGGANLTLTTEPASLLGQLIGGSSTGFPIIQQFNTFSAAQMEVSR
ncbi:MAG TPA: hypothetical protein VHP99_01980 [Pyrinomonadaceae bacterium]|jgi:hypothetical protein|nr:hypothetical protein [Pyrinomonadaceae bacterium]